MKFTICEFGPVRGRHQHGVAYKCFRTGAVVHALQAHHINAFAW